MTSRLVSIFGKFRLDASIQNIIYCLSYSYCSDGTSFRVTSSGLEKLPGIFISRLVPGGLAEGTGLLAVNDEVIEVNGIEIAGKSLDQVTCLHAKCSYTLHMY